MFYPETVWQILKDNLFFFFLGECQKAKKQSPICLKKNLNPIMNLYFLSDGCQEQQFYKINSPKKTLFLSNLRQTNLKSSQNHKGVLENTFVVEIHYRNFSC
jgi:hypothetical protein